MTVDGRRITFPAIDTGERAKHAAFDDSLPRFRTYSLGAANFEQAGLHTIALGPTGAAGKGVRIASVRLLPMDGGGEPSSPAECQSSPDLRPKHEGPGAGARPPSQRPYTSQIRIISSSVLIGSGVVGEYSWLRYPVYPRSTIAFAIAPYCSSCVSSNWCRPGFPAVWK